MGLGIGLAHSLASKLVLIPHLGIGIGYLDWVLVHKACIMMKKSSSDMGTLELELGIGLAHSLSSMLILMPHLGIGIWYWIGS